MAAWDGSYQGGSNEDQNLAYTQQEHVTSNSQATWYNDYPTSERSTPLNAYQGTSHCYFEDNRSSYYQQQATLVSQSKLKPNADEFIPSGSVVDSAKVFFPDNKNKNDRKYDSKRNQSQEYSRKQKEDYANRNYNRRQKNTFPQTHHTNRNHQEIGETESSLSRESFNNSRRAKSHGRFQNGQPSNYNSANFNGHNDTPLNSEQPINQKNAHKVGQKHHSKGGGTSSTASPTVAQYSDDPRDESYRKNPMQQRNRTTRSDPRRVKYDLSEKRVESSRREKRRNYNECNGGGAYRKREGEEDIQQNRANIDNDKNWRKRNNHNGSIGKRKSDLDDAASQKERLTDHLNKGKLECLVCCDNIKQNDAIWSCKNCYHVLHLKCIKKWAQSSQSESGWRCPACQNNNLIIPEEYYCFCGKTRDPEWNRRDSAHSCGEVCGRMRAKNNCIHKCTLLCHPGSCPLCTSMVTKYCGCGKTTQSLKCSNDTQLTCQSVCEKVLNCRIHKCQRLCHNDPCGICNEKIHQICHCGKESRDIICDETNPEATFACQNICDKLLTCGNHHCKEQCHPGPCGTCPLAPESINHCSCGQTSLTVKRQSCRDPVPTCEKICSKKLGCGQPSNPHTCKFPCHSQEHCPPCDSTTWVKCRCGNMDKEIDCKDLKTKADDARCQKKCIKKRSCGKHKCNQYCCIDIDHICPLACSKTLSCGRHKCELTCHKGRCQPCYRSSFEELYCECGTAVIYPPVPCGTRRPTCTRPCSRQHPCGHEVLHNCHSEPNCPPCTVLTQKWCYGKHELRKAVPCYINEMSCGLPCGKPISCGHHKCVTLCHSGPCEKPGQICIQPCTKPREMCGHPCAAPCHQDAKCPDSPCKETVKVTCACGHRSTTRICADNAKEYQRIASGILASKMADMQLGHSVNLEEVFGQGAKKQNQLKTLPCNDECALIERNRKMALGLQIVNPDLSGKLQPRYTDFMKQWAKKDPNFCQMVHEKLTELVQLAKSSKQKSRSYSFDSMNRDKRHFIHEACEHFGCESQAYDQEPKRNVVATAVRDKCWLPSYSLLEVVQRENGQRKVPRPMLNTTKTNNTLTLRTSEVLPSTAKMSQKLQVPTAAAAAAAAAVASTSKTPEPEIDYFDFPNPKLNNA